MEKNETQEVVSSKDKILGRLSNRFPDRSFKGQDGIYAQDAMDDSIEELLAEYESTISNYREHTKSLLDLFENDAMAARVFMGLAAGEKIEQRLLAEYGPTLLDALQSEEGQQALLAAQEVARQKKEKDDELQKEAEANIQESLKNVEAFQTENNLSDEQTLAIVNMLNKVAADIHMGIYTPESIRMAMNAINHDKDVQVARTEGEIEGRNTRIKEKLRNGRDMGNLPPSLGGQGASAGEKRPASKRRTAIDMFALGDE